MLLLESCWSRGREKINVTPGVVIGLDLFLKIWPTINGPAWGSQDLARHEHGPARQQLCSGRPEVNRFLPGGARPLARSWCYLGVFPKYSGIGWQRDGCPTRAHGARGAWVPTAMSHCSRCWRLVLPKRGNAYLHRGALGHAKARIPISGS
jgi:hypothetical protein